MPFDDLAGGVSPVITQGLGAFGIVTADGAWSESGDQCAAAGSMVLSGWLEARDTWTAVGQGPGNPASWTEAPDRVVASGDVAAGALVARSDSDRWVAVAAASASADVAMTEGADGWAGLIGVNAAEPERGY